MTDVAPIPETYPRVSPHLVQAPEDHFYEDRVAMFDDAFGHRRTVATHVEDVPPDEIARRMADAMRGD